MDEPTKRGSLVRDCDECGTRAPDDGWPLPDGWVYTDGRELCRRCRPDRPALGSTGADD